jgi:membrane protein YfhO
LGSQPRPASAVSDAPPSTEPRRWTRARYVVPAILALVAVALFPDAFLLGRVFYHRDIHLQWVPQIEVLVRTVAAGSWPVWNPYASFGQPLLANPNFEVYYPPTLLNLVMAPWTYYRLFVFVHVLVGGTGCYALGRRLGLSPLAAGLGSVAWIASGPFVSLVSLWNHLAGAAWMPWAGWAAHRTVTRPTLVSAALWGAFMAAPVLAGSPEMTLFTATFGLLVALITARHTREARRAASAAVLAGIIALGLSAAQWMPTMELAVRSRRADLPAAHRQLWSVPRVGLLQCVLPVLLDELPLRPEVRVALYESGEPFLRSLYLGLPAAVLVAIACATRRRAAVVLACLAVAMAGLALGRHAPIAALMEALVPPLRGLRFPAKAMVPASLAWALLVAMGLDVWMSAKSRSADSIARVAATVLAIVALAALWLVHARAEAIGEALFSPELTDRPFPQILGPVRLSLLATAIAVTALAALAWWGPRGRAFLGPLAAVLVGGDLVLAHTRLSPVSDKELFTFRPPALAYLAPPAGGRVYSFDYSEPGRTERYPGHPGYFMKVPRDKWPVPWADAAALRAGLYPSVLPQWRVQDGFRIDWLGLYPPHMTALIALSRRSELTPAFLKMMQLGAVTHVVSLHKVGLENLTPVADVPNLFTEDLHVFRVPDPLPPAYVVDGVRVATDAEAAPLLIDPSFDPRREIVVPAGRPAPPTPGFAGSARIVEWRPNRVSVEAELSAPGYVVLVESYDPSWEATIDGGPAIVLRANVGFRAVAVPEGTHRVVLRYRPRAAMVGLAVTLATLGAVATIGTRRRREVN